MGKENTWGHTPPRPAGELYIALTRLPSCYKGRAGREGGEKFVSGEGEKGEKREGREGVGMRGKWEEGIGRGREGKGKGGSGRESEARESEGRAPSTCICPAPRVSSYATEHSCACCRSTYSALFAMGQQQQQCGLSLPVLLPSVPSTHHSHHSSRPHSFIPLLKPFFSTNSSHRSLPFLLQD